MSQHIDPADEQPKAAAMSSHSLSWIAMVTMAAMCLGALIYAASINVG